MSIFERAGNAFVNTLVMLDAGILLYPTAIGGELQDPSLDYRGHCQRTMQGHAAANLVPLVASNRIGTEPGSNSATRFYGHSFSPDQPAPWWRRPMTKRRPY